MSLNPYHALDPSMPHQSLDTAQRAGPPPITKKPVQKKLASSAGYPLLELTVSFEARSAL